MAEKLQNQLKEVGSNLENPPATKDALIDLLTQAATCLSEMDQSPHKDLLESMQPLLKAIVKPELLKHQDNQIKLLVATCTCEITRITAPEAPYDDDVLRDIFHLFVSTFVGLKDTKDPSFGRIVNILDTVAKYRSFVVMLDLECDDLVKEMFKTFFTVVSDEHSDTVTVAMETIMAVLLEESEDIEEDLLLIVLSILGRNNKDISSAARKLAMNVIKQCAEKIEAGIKKFILSSIKGDKSSSNSQIDYHEVIYDIYRCAPQALSQIVSNLTKELQTDKTDIRLKAVNLFGDLFALEGTTIPKTFLPIFLEFLKRSTDKVVEIRMSVLNHIKLCLLPDASRPEASKLVAALTDRLLDEDESIRKHVVSVIADVASMDLSSISVDTIKLVAERLEDKSLIVKKYTIERLSDIYRIWCLKKIGGSNLNDDYNWIPGKILKCSNEKDFGLDTVEQILSTSLFPVEFPVKDKVKLISKFDKVEVSALEKILENKQRLQIEMQKYLSLRQNYKDNSDISELQKKTTICIRSISNCFVDPIKTETDFQILDQLKDDNIWRILTTLLDPNTNSPQIRSLRDELVKLVDNKNPVYELVNSLSIKCSYIIFDKEFVKELLLETDLQKCEGNKLLTQSCMNILSILASYSPSLLSGIEEDLGRLLEDDDEAIKEGVLNVLAKAGETICEQSGESSSSLDLILERICLEGNRKQAKYAVHALAAITKDEGLKSLSVLYKRLVDTLEKRTNLPSVLQSLGCIAQMAMPVFETQEAKVVNFIRNDILKCSQKIGDKSKEKESWDKRSEVCSLKIFGIKTLVKSYLPVKDAHLRVGIDELIKDLQNILSFGEISKDVESSLVDKAHLKLASGKAIIRLSKHWDKKIPVDIFHPTLRTSEVGFPEVRKQFLKKVHEYIKDKSLDPKYVCAFFLDFEPQKSLLKEENQNLSDIIQTGGISSILPYLIHVFAHHPSCPNVDECKDVKAYEPIYRKLYMFFSKLARVDEDGKPEVGLKREEIILIISVVRNIKSSKDVVDTNMSKNSYAICDLCLSITKRLAQKQEDFHESVVPVSLPQILYTPNNKKQENKENDLKEEKIEENIEEKKENEKKDDEKKENEEKENEEKENEKKENEEKENEKKENEEKEDEKKENEEKEDEKKENEKNKEVETEVPEGRTWLADENALAYFESLIFDANGNDIETDGHEVPLGKILKRIKAKGSKGKKVAKKNGSTNAVVENENNVDILGMLKEINSENVDVLNKFDSSNGNGKLSNEAKLKRKGISNDLNDLSVPKRPRSSSAKSQKKSTFIKSGSAFNIIKMDDIDKDDDDDIHSGSEDKVTDKKQSKNTDEVDFEKPKKRVETDSNEKSGSARKRKRRSVSGLAKCTTDETETKTNTKDLIGKRIKVWWPMDKEFYEGMVKSYDKEKKKHVVLYDDGDIEVLCLDKERWKLVENDQKRKHLSNTPPRKGGSSKKKIKSSSSSKQTKESSDISPTSTVRGKRTPRKNLKQGQKGVSQRAAYLEMRKTNDSDEEDEVMHSSSDEEKQMKDATESDDSVSSQEIEKEIQKSDSESEENENEKSHKSDSDSEESNQEESGESQSPESASYDSDKAEFTDDEPLGVWKSRIGKSGNK